MKNIAVIFAGGTGTRMKSGTKPKQFLELHGKPIIIHTLEHFENHEQIDEIIVVCIDGWHDYLRSLLEKFTIKKVTKIVSGGNTGQMSIYNGLAAIEDVSDTAVLIHDGVRPLINRDIITRNIESVKAFGNAITTKPVIETVIQIDSEENITNVVDRNSCMTAVAPQSFWLKDILEFHRLAQKENFYEAIDSASLARKYGMELKTVLGGPENIKITTPSDFYIFRAIYEARENAQIFG
ncbi:IspD/TarI family cytidylyltransferase [Tuanshanicoccus lijuaniae]|uniref:IspD/TarI family cytidylyltransferase n=1 Tax=Aerococcaceae bacterium zg-1292 TaxID=2774330 RepID=UPI001BD82D87|nr:2-C-methyl-D-erythritol 4-phosphate cytidylyltransferase [Aerococcaceae bacterium zg-BR9]MBF6977549.1 2-C-methyl-D-erythritol 4-phosphate cytidylyltransferase [Aerococcaceae bacterium zg-BR22]MBS4456654.1 2-C-methyl-D-erythritol 4-phosphate cytidylyltransferase [Aerococcaceae bacterium zg-A91]MBS4458446.1 2-C-methyl-D-erythritol 4-phosphate cytidylyltransferase [Aerococcaceae bacterium zg-BR33]